MNWFYRWLAERLGVLLLGAHSNALQRDVQDHERRVYALEQEFASRGVCKTCGRHCYHAKGKAHEQC